MKGGSVNTFTISGVITRITDLRRSEKTGRWYCLGSIGLRSGEHKKGILDISVWFGEDYNKAEKIYQCIGKGRYVVCVGTITSHFYGPGKARPTFWVNQIYPVSWAAWNDNDQLTPDVEPQPEDWFGEEEEE